MKSGFGGLKLLHTLNYVAHLKKCCTPYILLHTLHIETPYILLHTLNIVAYINFTPGMLSPTPPLQSGHAKRKSTHQAVNGRIAPSAKQPCSRCNASASGGKNLPQILGGSIEVLFGEYFFGSTLTCTLRLFRKPLF